LVNLMLAAWNSFCAVRSVEAPVPALPKLGGFAARQFDEFGERLRRHRRIDHRDALIPHRETYAFEALHGVPAGLLVEARVDQHRGSGDQPGVTVRVASCDGGRADIAVGAGSCFDHDRLLQVAADLLGHGAGDDVDNATGGIGHHDVDRPVRIIALGAGV
jgi:hypothetical protein